MKTTVARQPEWMLVGAKRRRRKHVSQWTTADRRIEHGGWTVRLDPKGSRLSLRKSRRSVTSLILMQHYGKPKVALRFIVKCHRWQVWPVTDPESYSIQIPQHTRAPAWLMNMYLKYMPPQEITNHPTRHAFCSLLWMVQRKEHQMPAIPDT